VKIARKKEGFFGRKKRREKRKKRGRLIGKKNVV
jgi:hypothetical protein